MKEYGILYEFILEKSRFVQEICHENTTVNKIMRVGFHEFKNLENYDQMEVHQTIKTDDYIFLTQMITEKR
jgi:hypothetical protein